MKKNIHINRTRLKNYDNEGSINSDFDTNDQIYLESFSQDLVIDGRMSFDEIIYPSDYAILNRIDVGKELFENFSSRYPAYRNIYSSILNGD